MEYFDRILDAAVFAAEAHKGQTRKYTGEPYINHPIMVAARVEGVRGTSEQIIAALLHDTMEDCGVTYGEISTRYGKTVAEYVNWLTDVSKPSDGNRVVRKAIDRQHSADAPPEVKTIKLADLLDNTESITEHDADFAKVYMPEKSLLLPFLVEGNEILFKQAEASIQSYYDSLKGNSHEKDPLRYR